MPFSVRERIERFLEQTLVETNPRIYFYRQDSFSHVFFHMVVVRIEDVGRDQKCIFSNVFEVRKPFRL